MGKNKDRNIGKVKGKNTYVQIGFERPVTIRSLRIPSTAVVASDSKVVSDIYLVLETIVKGKRTKVATLKVPDGCWMDKQHSITLAVPEITTKELRITFAGKQEPFLGYLFLQSNPRTDNWEAKAAFALRELMQDHVLQYGQECTITPNRILDLSHKLSANRLDWSPPKGDWTILRFGHVNMEVVNGPSPKELQGWESSKLDKAALENHLRKGMIGQLNQPGGAVGDGKLKGLLADSWERMIPTWTMHKEGLFREFQKRRGYDLRPFMPAMAGYVIQDQSVTDKFLRDLRETMDDLYVEHFFAHFTTVTNDMGAKSYIEGATGEVLPGDALRYYGAADIPMTEFWYRKAKLSDEELDYKPVKYAASAAHVYNKQRVAAEACTEGGSNWTEDFYCVKSLIDQHFALGVNHLVFHTFTHNPEEVFPGSTFGGTTGFPFVRNQTWWKHMPAFTDYLSRCQYILQQGEYVADVLWYLGDELERPPYQMAAFPDGYQYDHLNSEVLLSNISLQNGNLTIKDGSTYRILWLRGSQRMLRSTAEKIKELVMAGAVVLGDKPVESPSLMDKGEDVATLHAIADELWGNEAFGMKSVGKGKVYWGQSIADVLKAEAVQPDLIAPKKLNAYWHHRKTADADLYFLSSQNDKATDATISFRITGKLPELWNPLTGEQHPAGVWQVKEGKMQVAIPFDPSGSAVVVFRNPAPKASITQIKRGDHTILSSEPGWVQEHAKNKANPLQLTLNQLTFWEPGDYKLTSSNGQTKTTTVQVDAQALNNSWRISFDKRWGTPESLVLDALIPLSDHENKTIQYYSGTVTYHKTMNLVDSDNLMLDLGKVGDIAEAWCNGKQVGTRWAPPFVFDLSDVAKKGANELEIKVTNTWRNQLIYDARRPQGQKKTWTSNPPKKNESPHPFGLMGPVFIRSSVPRGLDALNN
ncbi:glycosyl hydrolase [Planctomycetota bacterium]